MTATPAGQRRYRGLSPEERREQRRRRLLDAALDLFTGQGYANTSVRDVCQAAGLNPRYFYESFTSQEDLLYHLYLEVVTDIATRVNTAVESAGTLEDKARAGLEASWRAYTRDRRRARIIAIEVVGVSERLEHLRRELRHGFADRLAAQGLSFAGPGMRLRLDPVVVARALMGGVMDTLVDVVNDDCPLSVDEIIEHFTILFAAAARASVEPDPAAPAPAPPPRRRPSGAGRSGRGAAR